MRLLKATTGNKLWILYSVNYVNGFGRYWSSTYIEKARSLFSHQTDVRVEEAVSFGICCAAGTRCQVITPLFIINNISFKAFAIEYSCICNLRYLRF